MQIYAPTVASHSSLILELYKVHTGRDALKGFDWTNIQTLTT